MGASRPQSFTTTVRRGGFRAAPPREVQGAMRRRLLLPLLLLGACREQEPARPPPPLPLPRATRLPGHKVDRPPPAELLGVEVALADGLTPPKGAVLIVTIRSPGEAGAQLAKRVGEPLFPLRVSVTEADVVAGLDELPARLEVRARLDSDGDGATSAPDDPEASWTGPADGPEPRLVLERRAP